MHPSGVLLAALAALRTCAAQPTPVRLVWEPVKSEAFCKALPHTKKQPGGRAFPATYGAAPAVTDEEEKELYGYACQRFIGPRLVKSPDRYFDAVQGAITTPEPKSLDCDEDVGARCDGVLDLNLTAHNEITFMWQSGAQQGSAFVFLPPIGPITATFLLRSDTCTGTQLDALNLDGRCEAIDLLDTWLPKDERVLSDQGMMVGQRLNGVNGNNGLRFAMDLLTVSGASPARIQQFGIKCTYDPERLPAGCGGMQEWRFGLEDPFASMSHNEPNLATQYGRRLVDQSGVAITHPFFKKQIQVQKGYPTPEDPCLALERTEMCALNLFVSQRGPCYWNNTHCVTSDDLVPAMAPENTTIYPDGAVFDVTVPTFSGLDRVLAVYYTVGQDGVAAEDPKLPDPDDPMTANTYSCAVPCQLSYSNPAPGVYEFKFMAHLEATMAGKLRQIFLSKTGSKTYTIVAPPTPGPTPSPPLPAGTMLPPTPTPPTSVPPTPAPATPAPPTPGPTPLPLLTDPPIPPPTPRPSPAPDLRLGDPCEPLGEAECLSPCAWAQTPANPECAFNMALGPVVMTGRMRDCLANDPNDYRCHKIPLAPEESIAITHDHKTHYNYSVSAIWYMQCNSKAPQKCIDMTASDWSLYPYAADDVTRGIKVPKQDGCSEDDARCREIKVLAYAEIVLYIGENAPTLATARTVEQFFIQDETLPPTPEPVPPTPEPLQVKTLEPLAAAPEPKEAPWAAILIFVAFLFLILSSMAFVAFRIWKKGQEQYEDELDEMDEDEMDEADYDDDDDSDEYVPPPRRR
eukprot:TRINITY_DN9289_c0_g1_i1.p1 TRINITY_DN9289_c0_g1~~TRINITY_DN9289_c0_g1_i1.p1  ORF type:complete len:813 (+),score=204.99 TRINITY_DN9289_c0_g1_i1:44-2440(+)